MQKCDNEWKKRFEEAAICHHQEEAAYQNTIKMKEKEILSLKFACEEFKKVIHKRFFHCKAMCTCILNARFFC